MNKVFVLVLLSILSYSCVSQEKEKEPVKPKVEEINAVDMDLAFLQGRFDPNTKPNQFVRIGAKHADKADMYMQKEAYTAFIQMYDAALKEGISLQIRSATRNFSRQKTIWENKWTGKTILSDGTRANDINNKKERVLKILEYSSMPSTSRHHWGTDIDLNSFNNKWFETGEGNRLYTWMVENAKHYGYCQPYTEKTQQRPDGYNEEKWHWSYAPLATSYINTIKKNQNDYKIYGFLGAETSDSIHVIEKYIFGINKECK